MGIEFEYSEGALRVLNGLADRRQAQTRQLHGYHCRCDVCDYGREDYNFFAQSDCTANGEIITHVLKHDTPRFDEAITNIAEVVHDVRPGISTGVGMHTHVSHEDFTPKAFRRLWRFWVRYQEDLADLAAGSFSAVRSYNEPFNMDYYGTAYVDRLYDDDDSGRRGFGGSWLVHKSNTMEFRLWNATTNEWRIRLAAGISTAIMDAVAPRNVGGGALEIVRDDERSLIEVLEPFVNEQAYAGLLRQLKWKDA
jgi:hypothetical protein